MNKEKYNLVCIENSEYEQSHFESSLDKEIVFLYIIQKKPCFYGVFSVV